MTLKAIALPFLGDGMGEPSVNGEEIVICHLLASPSPPPLPPGSTTDASGGWRKMEEDKLEEELGDHCV